MKATLFEPMNRFCSTAIGAGFLVVVMTVIGANAHGGELLVEAESFAKHGGWSLDTQFIDTIGSPYLLAHGLGKPVADATTTVRFPAPGRYRVFARTKDWVAHWKAPGKPGRFQLLINGQPLDTAFGIEGDQWHWQPGGEVTIAQNEVTLSLRDLTGFDGRCDAIYFTTEDQPPPNDSNALATWRTKTLGLPSEPIRKDGYDLVVIGGGYAGMGAALSAARLGCRVALIQNRPVLGGNGSSEVRVWAQGNIRRGKFPRIGEIVEEFADRATKSPGTFEEFEDAKKEALVRAEKNIELFLNHHAYRVDSDGHHLDAVYAFDTRTSERKKFVGRLYADCTGHATIGWLAQADWEMEPNGRMGMSNMWTWAEGEKPVKFPSTPWALELNMDDFPYPRNFHGEWFWESGFDKDPIGGAELIRDWNLRAVFGAFQAMKSGDAAAKHANAYLTWIAYIGGPRESRRLLGDVILTQEDIVTKREFPDGCVPSTWSIDLHYPKQQYAKKFADNPFISIAVHDQRIDRNYGYPIPYRCFYSRKIDNLFMAGRNISVTHEALGTTRVMKTCGMMGEVVGKATAICVKHDCWPREVYERYWSEMDELLKLPGKARRATLNDPIVVPADALPLAGPLGPPTGLDPTALGGVIVDDRDAEKSAGWTEGAGLKGFVGYGYVYASPSTKSTIRYQLKAPRAGRYDVRISYQPHENRGDRVPVTVSAGAKTKTVQVNMKRAAPLPNGFASLGPIELEAGQVLTVVISSEQAGGNAHADAVQIIPMP